MLELEVPNLHELDLDRVIAYGHTWSPTLELTPEPPLFHGHAISVDMAFSATLAEQRGLITPPSATGCSALFSSVGLAIDSPYFTAELLERATAVDHADPRRPAARGGAGADRHLPLRQRPDGRRAACASWRVHKELCAGYPRGGEGVDQYTAAES